MSIKALKWVAGLGLQNASLSVMICLADHHNQKTGNCFPSVQKMIERTGYSERTIRDTLKLLESAGRIRRRERFANGRQTSNQYDLLIDNEGCSTEYPSRKRVRGAADACTAPTKRTLKAPSAEFSIKEAEVIDEFDCWISAKKRFGNNQHLSQQNPDSTPRLDNGKSKADFAAFDAPRNSVPTPVSDRPFAPEFAECAGPREFASYGEEAGDDFGSQSV